MAKLNTVGIAGYREYSGFKGEHVWVFFKEPLNADLVKTVFTHLLNDVSMVDDNMHIELFPKQSVLNGGPGSLVKPPLQIHLKSGKQSYFIDDENMRIAGLPTSISRVSKKDLESVVVPENDDELVDEIEELESVAPFNMNKMFIKCEKLTQFKDDANNDRLNSTLGHDARICLASVLKPFTSEGFKELTNILSSTADFNEAVTKHHWDSLGGNPVTCQKICGNYRCQNILSAGGKSPIKFAYERDVVLPIEFIERDNCYYKNIRVGNNFQKKIVATFNISPNELLVLDDCDCLACDIVSSQGFTYKNILLENTDWHSKNKLLKAIGHQDCAFVSSENDLQALCSYVSSKTHVRKKGTKTVGLHEGTWVVNGMNISKRGVLKQMSIVPYNKGKDAFYNSIEYLKLNDTEYRQFITAFYEYITQINTPEVIFPLLGWFFSTPIRTVLLKELDGFSLMFAHGGQGDGKTVTCGLFNRLSGFKDSKPNTCTMRPFPMLKLLTSTNGIPVWFDEFKVGDMRQDQVDNLLRFMRKAYFGEVEQKGLQDQSVIDYKITAPLMVSGEWNINQPAIKERLLLIRFTNVIKTNKKMQAAYERIKLLPMEGFMPRYIQFLLNQDIKSVLKSAKLFVDQHFQNMEVAPRIISNLSVMVLGLRLFEAYGKKFNINLPAIDYGNLLNSQLKNITGSETGFVKSAVDQLIEELAIMALNRKLEVGYDYKFANITCPGGIKTKLLTINFKKIFPDFKEYAQRTKYEGEILDRESYFSLFKECSYIPMHDTVVKYTDYKSYRCICINTTDAKEAGVNLDGFAE